VREGACKLGKQNYTEDESGMKNRKVTWESKGEFRKRNVGTVRHSEPSWESEGEFGKRKASTTRNSEPKSRTPRISGSVSKGLAGDALLNELKTSIVPKLGPRGNPAGKLGLGSDLKSAPRIQTPKISDPIRKGLAGDAVLNALKHPIGPRLGPRGNSFDKLGPHEERPENSDIKGSTELEGLSKDLWERKATKSDDSPVSLSMWEEHLISDGARRWTVRERRKLEPACDTLRTPMLIWWKGRVSSSFRAWLNKEYADTFGIINKRWGSGVKFVDGKYVWSKGRTSQDEYKSWWRARMLACPEDLMAGMDALKRACGATWWEWDDGSRPFHWRWPKEYQERIRDGIKVHFRTATPRYVVPQRDVRDPKIKEKVIEKLQKVRMRRYIADGYVVSLTSFFDVPKGDDDIRLVYDGSVGGLNDSLWVPRFALSTLNGHLRAVEEGT
jgi:hypothetical protein